MRKFGVVLMSSALILGSCSDNSSNPAGRRADPPDTTGTERVLLEVQQYLSNHNGGGLTFDNDGYLYLGLGDGGGGGDNEDNAQNPVNLLGTILRLQVIDSSPWFSVPGDNPFVGNTDGWREEIFAYGMRNPWRISVDPVTNTLWAGDVGQGIWEEIDIIASGGNYGWDCREGLHEYTGPPDAPSPDCAGAGGFIDPVWEYQHLSGNVSITGGYVYRGSALPGLVGKYIYADYASGRIWALTTGGGPTTNELLVDAPFLISSFGVDENNELILANYLSGSIWKIVDTGGAYAVENAFPDLTFASPVDLRHAGDGSGRLFVVEQEGRVKAFDTASPDSSWTYLDLVGRVTCCGEQGLLGLAFHPAFASNGYLYVYYTSNSSGLVGRLSRIKAE